MPAKRLINQLRDKYTALAKNAGKWRSYAIRLHCLECMGGNAAEVRRCTAPECALFPFRLLSRSAHTCVDGEPEIAGDVDGGPVPVDAPEKPISEQIDAPDGVRPTPAAEAPDA